MIFKGWRDLAHSLPMCELCCSTYFVPVPPPTFLEIPRKKRAVWAEKSPSACTTQAEPHPRLLPPSYELAYVDNVLMAQAVGSLKVPSTVFKNLAAYELISQTL